MRKTIPCSKCQNETKTKHVTVNLTIDEVTKHTVPVSARIQICHSCGHRGYTEKEMSRLRGLAGFYLNEFLMKEEKQEQVN